jgi:hypothetical protein
MDMREKFIGDVHPAYNAVAKMRLSQTPPLWRGPPMNFVDQERALHRSFGISDQLNHFHFPTEAFLSVPQHAFLCFILLIHSFYRLPLPFRLLHSLQ